MPWLIIMIEHTQKHLKETQLQLRSFQSLAQSLVRNNNCSNLSVDSRRCKHIAETTLRFIQVLNLRYISDCRLPLVAQNYPEYLQKLLIIFLSMLSSFFESFHLEHEKMQQRIFNKPFYVLKKKKTSEASSHKHVVTLGRVVTLYFF